MPSELIVAVVVIPFTVASLIVRFLLSTWPFVQGWFGFVNRCSIPFASPIKSKRIFKASDL